MNVGFMRSAVDWAMSMIAGLSSFSLSLDAGILPGGGGAGGGVRADEQWGGMPNIIYFKNKR